METLERRQLLSASATSTPFGAAAYVAGQTIEAENFDAGGEGVAYHNPGRSNPAKSSYRTNTSIGTVTAGPTQAVVGGASNGHYVGYTTVGEWLNYTVVIPTSGNYLLAARVADINAGAKFHATLDLTHSTSEMTIPRTPTWTSWHTVESSAIALTAGRHVLRITMDTSSAGVMSVGNFDWFQLVPIAAPASFNWKAGPASTEKQFEPRATVVGGKLYAFGGYTAVTQFGANNTFQLYDPSTNRWKNLGKMPIPQTHAALAADDSTGIVYFVGGLFGLYPGTATSQVWSYKTHTNLWKQLPSLPEPLSGGTAAIVDGKLHYFGGNIGQARDIDQPIHLVLDLNQLSKKGSAAWQIAKPLPEARDHLSATTLNGKIYILGGEVGHDTNHLQQNHCFCYDPAADTWTQIADMPVPRSHIEASSFVYDGKIIIAGGQTDDFLATNTILEYDPAKNRWYQLGNLPLALEGEIVQPVGSKLLLAGGYDGVSGVSSNAVYVGQLPVVGA